jgi:hypothetical protein
MVLMATRYGHIGQQAKNDAVAVLDRFSKPKEENTENRDHRGAVKRAEKPVNLRGGGTKRGTVGHHLRGRRL